MLQWATPSCDGTFAQTGANLAVFRRWRGRDHTIRRGWLFLVLSFGGGGGDASAARVEEERCPDRKLA